MVVAGVVLSQMRSCRIFYSRHRATCRSAHCQNTMRLLIILVSEILTGILERLSYFSTLKATGECKLV